MSIDRRRETLGIIAGEIDDQRLAWPMLLTRPMPVGRVREPA
ncbi:hypothetical protein [Mesorhizobium sp. M0203]